MALVARDWDELGVCLGEVGVLVHAAWTAVLVDVVFFSAVWALGAVAGSLPTASHFLLLHQKKVTKKKASLAGGCLAELTARLHRCVHATAASGHWYGASATLAHTRVGAFLPVTGLR